MNLKISIVAALLAALGPSARGAEIPPMTPLEFKEKLSQLASESWDTREAAEERLVEAYDERVELAMRSRWALRAFGADMGDAEVAERVGRIRFEGREGWLKARLSADCPKGLRVATMRGDRLLIDIKDDVISFYGCSPEDFRAMTAFVLRRLKTEDDPNLAQVGAFLAKDAEQGVAGLEPFLSSPHPAARREALRGLRFLEPGPDVIEALGKGLEDGDSETAAAAFHAANYLSPGPEKAAVLARGLAHPSISVRGEVLTAFIKLGIEAAAHADAVTALLKQGDRGGDSGMACRAVAALLPDEKGAAILGEALSRSPSERVRQNALEALVAMSESTATRAAALTQLPAIDAAAADDPEPTVRSWAKRASQCVRDGQPLVPRSSSPYRCNGD
jgi:hypothetical protein